MKKIWKHLFNQNMLYILLMLVQIAFLVLSVLFLNRNYAWVYGALLLLNGLLIIYITNSRKNPTYKNAWLVVIAVLPIFGGLSYLFLKTRRDTRIFFRNYKQQMEQTKPLLTQEPDAARHLFNDSQQVYNLSELCKINGITVSGLLAELKMSASNKQKWQNGATVNSSVLMKIADYFNVSVDYLLGRADNSTVLSESYIGGDNNGIQAIKNRGSVTIRQTTEKENNCKEIEVLLEKMPRSKQLRAIADIIDLLEEKYQEE